MIATSSSLLHQVHHQLSPPPEHCCPELNLSSLKEQQCLTQLKTCKNMEDFKLIHTHVVKFGFLHNPFAASNLLLTCALSDWGSMDYACSIFRQMEEPVTFDFNCMIRGFVKDMSNDEALFFYCEMMESGVEPDKFTYPFVLKACAKLRGLEEGMQIHGHVFKLGFEEDEFVMNSLISMYGKCGKIELSCAVFDRMDDCCKGVASWSAIISAHASLKMWSECLILFECMNRGGHERRPEESILVSVLSACTHLGAIDLGRSVHGFLLRNIRELNPIVETSLIDMYVKCGSLEKGLSVFERMHERNQLSYSSMISGMAMHGHGREALKVFSDMLKEGLQPDDVVYVSLLSACSHAGIVDEGLQCFERMVTDHDIEPTIQHYGCFVDLLGRAGMINEAIEFIRKMPIKPNEIVWRSLLSACKMHHNLEIGEIAAKYLFKSNLTNPSDYTMLSNIYARDQRWKDVAKVRVEMNRKGLNQTPGCSLVEVERKVYKFVSQDKSHPKCKEIYEMIHQMEWQLKFEGYVADTSQILLDVDEDEKKERLKAHSQKLAIAFALIHSSHGSPIRITRNLRMCNDCHTHAKFISVVYEREITVRDRYRFHHFKDGTCSCKDYW
ncbi:hypothetical protein ACFE04_013552 [Oxalis oulophora]